MTALAAGIAIALAAVGVSLGIGLLASKTMESIARNPEVAGEIRQNFVLAMAFIEATAIYALVVAILIIFIG